MEERIFFRKNVQIKYIGNGSVNRFYIFRLGFEYYILKFNLLECIQCLCEMKNYIFLKEKKNNN